MMERMIIKVTLNSRNPAEAELMKILEGIKNKSAYLKMATLHYCNILGKLSQAEIRNAINHAIANTTSIKHEANTGQTKEQDWPSHLDTVFASAFDK
jgi:hypothetical protein